jgi:hypothetical protein
VQRGDVLQGDENVPVQLDVRNVLDRAVGGEDTFLILAAEERELDLLTLVLVRVVLDGAQTSGFRYFKRLSRSYTPWNALLVWSRCGLGIVCSAGNAKDRAIFFILAARPWGTRSNRCGARFPNAGLPWLMLGLGGAMVAAGGRDPAFGSGPLATVVQDILSITIYFAIAVPIVV